MRTRWLLLLIAVLIGGAVWLSRGGAPEEAQAPPSSRAPGDESLPEVSSPVGSAKHFFIPTSFGEFVCLDIETGEKVWFHYFDDGFYSSPIIVGDRIYALDMEGTMQMFAAAGEFKSLGSVKFGEAAYATPAYLDGRIYVRTVKHLYCIEGQDG